VPPGRRPLRRRPKVLDEEPVLHDASGGGAGSVRLAGAGRPAGRSRSPTGSAPGETEEAGALAGAGDDGELDRMTVRRAREIADRLSLPRPPRNASGGGAGGELVSRPYRGSADELDLDATLAALVEHPFPSDEDIIVRDRVRTRRAIALLVDVSGSMRGERIRTAAATVGALAGELDGDDIAVIAFWSDAAVIQHLGQRRAPRELLDEMLRISARGLTNVEFPLRVAARELARASGRDVRALLLSDCMHNAGPDPRPAAAALPRLDVMLDVSGENDPELGRALARLGHGRLAVARTYRDVAPGLSRLFRA
jgi:von Willebrand factor type A domain